MTNIAHTFEIIINRKPYHWPNRHITGAQIKQEAGSPADWVVNQIVAGPGEDPEIANDQQVDLSARGIEKFVTRKPTTSPGS